MEDQKDELIIVSHPILPDPSSAPLSSVTTLTTLTTLTAVPTESSLDTTLGETSEIVEMEGNGKEVSEVSLDRVETVDAHTPFYLVLFKKENRSLLIHVISDLILFFLFMNYIQNQFSITEKMIRDARQRVSELRKK